MCGPQHDLVVAHSLRMRRRSSQGCLVVDQIPLAQVRKEHEQPESNPAERLILSPTKNGSVDEAQLLARFSVLAHLPKKEMPIVHSLLGKTVTLLRACGYPLQDVCVILAHASVYYCDAIAVNGREMDPNEVAHVLVALIFLAHSYVEDNTCPLNVWHQRLCKDYCNLKLLNTAVMQLMKMRHWNLRVGDKDLSLRLSFLQSPGVNSVPARISSPIRERAPEATPTSSVCARQQVSSAGAAVAIASAAAAKARLNASPTRDRNREVVLGSRQNPRCTASSISSSSSSAVPALVAGLGGSLGMAASSRGWPEHLQPTVGSGKLSSSCYIATYTSLQQRSHCPTMSSNSPTRGWSSNLGVSGGFSVGRWPSQQVVCG